MWNELFLDLKLVCPWVLCNVRDEALLETIWYLCSHGGVYGDEFQNHSSGPDWFTLELFITCKLSRTAVNQQTHMHTKPLSSSLTQGSGTIRNASRRNLQEYFGAVETTWKTTAHSVSLCLCLYWHGCCVACCFSYLSFSFCFNTNHVLPQDYVLWQLQSVNLLFE